MATGAPPATEPPQMKLGTSILLHLLPGALITFFYVGPRAIAGVFRPTRTWSGSPSWIGAISLLLPLLLGYGSHFGSSELPRAQIKADA